MNNYSSLKQSIIIVYFFIQINDANLNKNTKILVLVNF